MDQRKEDRQQLVQEYRQLLEPLLCYLPWLESRRGKAVSHSYQGQGIDRNSMSFPVYEATLLRFVKEASVSPLMDRNYNYVYSRNRIRNHEDERRIIASAEIGEWDILRGILSKYVLGGMTKATLWGEAMREDIFVLVLGRMRGIVDYWDRTKR